MSTQERTGEFSKEHFHMLLVGTSIRGEEVKAALEEHLVRGTPKGESCKMHGANFSQFSVRLASIHDENKRVERMVQYYPHAIIAQSAAMFARAIESRAMSAA